MLDETAENDEDSSRSDDESEAEIVRVQSGSDKEGEDAPAVTQPRPQEEAASAAPSEVGAPTNAETTSEPLPAPADASVSDETPIAAIQVDSTPPVTKFNINVEGAADVASPMDGIFSDLAVVSRSAPVIAQQFVRIEASQGLAVAQMWMKPAVASVSGALKEALPAAANSVAVAAALPHFFSRVEGASRFQDGLDQFIAQCATMTPTVLKKPLSQRTISWIVTAMVIAVDVWIGVSLLRRRRRADLAEAVAA